MAKIGDFQAKALAHANAARVTVKNDGNLKSQGDFKAKSAAFFSKDKTITKQNEKAIAAFAKAIRSHYGDNVANTVYAQHLQARFTQGTALTAAVITQSLQAAETAAMARLQTHTVESAFALAKMGKGPEAVTAIITSAANPSQAVDNLTKLLNAIRTKADTPTGGALMATPSFANMQMTAQIALDTLVTDRTDAALGNTPLHALSGQAGQAVGIQAHLQNNPGNLNVPNALGKTPLVTAAMAPGNNSNIAALLNANADPNVGGLLNTFKTLDVARAVNQSNATITSLVNAGARSAIDPQQLIPTAVSGLSTEQILMRGALSGTAESRTFLQEGIQHLYQNPNFQPILDLAAQRMVGNANNHLQALRIYHLPNNGATALTGLPSAGAFNNETETLNLGSKDSRKDMEGTMIHELTHHAIWSVYQNDVLPFAANEMTSFLANQDITGTTLNTYLNAIADDTTHAATANHPDKTKIQELILGRVDGYRGRGQMLPQTPLTNNMTTAMLQEYIVGIPQAIHEYGLAAVQTIAPNLTNFYINNLLPAVTNQATQLAQRIP